MVDVRPTEYIYNVYEPNTTKNPFNVSDSQLKDILSMKKLYIIRIFGVATAGKKQSTWNCRLIR
jgi:hypothetical protein